MGNYARPLYFLGVYIVADTMSAAETRRKKEEDSLESVIASSNAATQPKAKFASDTKTYDPAKPYEIDGPAGKIGVIRGHINTQRLAGRAVATALQGLSVDQRTYEMTWMGVMLQFVTQAPGFLPPYCNGSIDAFLENLFEFEDLSFYYREWENWRNSFRVL